MCNKVRIILSCEAMIGQSEIVILDAVDKIILFSASASLIRLLQLHP